MDQFPPRLIPPYHFWPILRSCPCPFHGKRKKLLYRRVIPSGLLDGLVNLSSLLVAEGIPISLLNGGTMFHSLLERGYLSLRVVVSPRPGGYRQKYLTSRCDHSLMTALKIWTAECHFRQSASRVTSVPSLSSDHLLPLTSGWC
jgi:hypothetical protein